jgi:hypothetical protein
MSKNKVFMAVGILVILTFCTSEIFFSEEINGVYNNIGAQAISLSHFPVRNLSYVNSSNGLPMSGQWPYATRVGDLNNDGYMDIIRLRGHDDFNSPDQGFQIWLGDGTGNWTKTPIPNGNFGYGGTAIGDFNNDGFLDGAYGVHHNRNHPLVGAWVGDGGTNFIESSNGLGTDGETWGMAPIDFGDYNNDGFLDIGVGSFGAGNGIRAYMNINGGDLWQSKSNGLPYTGNFGDWLFWEDINRDGYLDIIACSDHELIWLGDGSGNWTGNDFGLPNNWGRGIDMGDINNDGLLDIVYIEHIDMGNDDYYIPVVYTFDGIGWTNASEGLPNPQTYPEVFFDPVAFGDLNNDGNLDLIGLEGYTTGSWPYYYDWTNIHAWIGNGQGNWSELNEVYTDIPGWPKSVTLADIDHNDYLDIIISSSRDDYEPGGLRVYKNTFNSTQLHVTVRHPLGGDVFRGNGIRKITWTSAVPDGTASVTLHYSVTGPQGPWISIKENITDNNYYQWTVPPVNTTNGYIKIILYWDNQTCSGINPMPFSIIEGLDILPPSIQNVTIFPQVQEVNKTLNITCIVSDNTGVADTRVIITYPNGSIVNESMPNIGSVFYWNLSYSIIGNYSFYIWSIDINGNSKSSLVYQFMIIPLQPITINLSLYQGWNLITIPMGNEWTAESLGQNISGCSLVLMFNGSIQEFTTHVVGNSYDDFPIAEGMGYFVRVHSDTVWGCTGLSIPSVNVTVYKGWNTIGWYHEYNTTAQSLGENVSTSLVLAFNATTQDFMTYVMNSGYDNFAIAQGMGVFIQTNTPGWWQGEG